MVDEPSGPAVYQQFQGSRSGSSSTIATCRIIEFTVERGHALHAADPQRQAHRRRRRQDRGRHGNEGLIDKRDARSQRVDPDQLEQLLPPARRRATAIERERDRASRASPGAAVAWSSSTPTRPRRGRGRRGGDPGARGNRRRRLHGMVAREGLLTAQRRHDLARGGGGARDGHALRSSGCGAIESIARRDLFRVGDHGRPEGTIGSRSTARRAGHSRQGADDPAEARTAKSQTLLAWADEMRTLGVRANADTPRDAAARARLRRGRHRPLPHRAHVLRSGAASQRCTR